MPPAARVTDPVLHPLPPVLTPGPGSLNVIIGDLPAWRGMPLAAVAGLSASKTTSDTTIATAEAATVAAAGTPGLPAAEAAEQATKAACLTSMSSASTSASGGADIHTCCTPLPIPPHGPGIVIDGSPTVLINNLPAARMGDTILEAIGPPNSIAMGCPTVIIGDSGSGGSPLGESGSGSAAPAPAPPQVPSTYGSGIKITGDDNFRKSTIQALDQIAKTPTGKALLDSIGNSGNTVTISPTTDGNETSAANWKDAKVSKNGIPGDGSDATVSYNPNQITLGPQPWQTRPPAIGLAHELIHAQHIGDGTVDTRKVPNDDKPNPDDPDTPATEIAEEVQTAGIPPNDKGEFTENKIRSEWDPPQPQRKWY